MARRAVLQPALAAAYFLFLAVSLATDFAPGTAMATNFGHFLVDMLKVLPPAFVLIGLFEVWVKRETVERHLGGVSGMRGYAWAVLLAGTTVGGLYVAIPIATALSRKGARLSVILTYVSATGICRIPMALFEASFLGPEFTAVRLLVSLPLIVVTSALLGKVLARRGYRLAGAGRPSSSVARPRSERR